LSRGGSGAGPITRAASMPSKLWHACRRFSGKVPSTFLRTSGTDGSSGYVFVRVDPSLLMQSSSQSCFEISTAWQAAPGPRIGDTPRWRMRTWVDCARVYQRKLRREFRRACGQQAARQNKPGRIDYNRALEAAAEAMRDNVRNVAIGVLNSRYHPGMTWRETNVRDFYCHSD